MTTDRRRCKTRHENAGGARHRRLLLAAAVMWAAALPLFPACSSHGKRASRPATRPVPVTAATATSMDVPVMLKGIGSIDAYNTVKVRPQVGGELIHVGFKGGQNVKDGNLLFTIDPRPFETALQTALADSARDSAKAASAEAEEQRYAQLVQKDYVTQQEYDEAKANAMALRATLQADEAACKNARLNLSFCSIRAPISGRTGDVLVHAGNLVKANDDNPLVVIEQIVPVYVTFSVPEQRLPEIRKCAAAGELRVEATVPGETTGVYTGELTFVDNAVDQTTGTILLKATFANADESLWPGQFVNVSLILTVRHGAVVIPMQSVQKGQQGSFVYLIKPDSSAAMQSIALGPETGGGVVVEEGLRAGDLVVTDGQLRLSPGAKVDIKPGVQIGGTARQ